VVALARIVVSHSRTRESKLLDGKPKWKLTIDGLNSANISAVSSLKGSRPAPFVRSAELRANSSKYGSRIFSHFCSRFNIRLRLAMAEKIYVEGVPGLGFD